MGAEPVFTPIPVVKMSCQNVPECMNKLALIKTRQMQRTCFEDWVQARQRPSRLPQSQSSILRQERDFDHEHLRPAGPARDNEYRHGQRKPNIRCHNLWSLSQLSHENISSIPWLRNRSLWCRPARAVGPEPVVPSRQPVYVEGVLRFCTARSWQTTHRAESRVIGTNVWGLHEG